MAYSTEELWFTDWEFGGPYWENPQAYEKWSPSSYVKHFKTPTLVVHGELDYRVPVEQAIAMFTALQRRSVLWSTPRKAHASWMVSQRLPSRAAAASPGRS